MTLEVDDLSRLSSLLDEAMDLDAAAREAWLHRLGELDAHLLPTLRRLLAAHDLKETDEALARGPAFTVIGQAGIDDASPFNAGELVGPYRLGRPIGQGGMGEVWLAMRDDGQLKRQVALKLPMLSARRSVLVQRFARERDILGSLAHPHIARLYDAGVGADGQPYLALEYVQGRVITAYCDEQRLDVRARVTLLLQVLQAVQYAHANLVIHRDLKPSNVLVTAQGQAMLLDFGIAKLLQEDAPDSPETELTRLGGRALTLAYAAPEQVSGAPISIATDVWALGVLLYEALGGSRPFAGKPRELERAILEDAPARPPGMPADLATILIKALKKVPAERYATVAALADDLQRWLDNEPVLAQPDSTWYRTRKFVGRNKTAVAVATGVLLTVIVAGGVSTWQAREASTQARLAAAQALRAEHEAKRAKAVQDFLIDLFQSNSDRQADPMKARQLTARELLDIGRQRVNEQLKNAPEAQDAVLETLAQMYVDIGLDDRAAELSGQLASLRERLYGPDDLRVAQALIREAATLNATSPSASALALMKRAERIMAASSQTTDEMRIEMHREFVGILRYSDVSAAIAHNRAARLLVDAGGGTPEAKRRLFYAEALMLEYLGDCTASQEAGQRAIGTAVNDGGAPQWQIPELLQLHAVAYCVNDLASAEDYLRRALEISLRVNGPSHVDTGHVQARLMLLLSDTSRPAESDTAARALREALDSKAGEKNANLQGISRRNLAWRALERGAIEEAEPALADRVAARRRTSGEGVPLSFEQQLWAEALAAEGRFEEASKLLDDSLVMKHKVLGADARPAAFASLQTDLADVALAMGDSAGALRLAAEVESAAVGAPREFRLALQRTARLRCRALVLAKRPAEAEAVAAAALDGRHLAFRPIDYPRMQADLLLCRGHALQALSRTDEAERAVALASALRHANDDAQSPWVAQADAALADIQIDLGRHASAKVLAHAAEDAMARHPRLDPGFTGPLAALRERLAGHAMTPERVVPRQERSSARAPSLLASKKSRRRLSPQSGREVRCSGCKRLIAVAGLES